VRLRKQDFSKRINGDVKIEFAPQAVTSYSGLELFRRYFGLIRLNDTIRAHFRTYDLGGDYSVVQLILVFIGLWLTGGRRLTHVRFLDDDPLVQRLCGLASLPSDRSLSRWLGRFTIESLQALVSLNSEIVTQKLKALGLKRITLDFDGTVLSCGDQVGLAARGYNPHNRHAKSYYPLLCHVAQTGHFLGVMNRPGSRHDSKGGAIHFMRDCLQKAKRLFPEATIEVRVDAAFFAQEIIELFERERVEYAVKIPLWNWLPMKTMIAHRQRWHHAGPNMAYFRERIFVKKWNSSVDATIYRIKLSDKEREPVTQLDLFCPDDGIYEFQVIASNKDLAADNLMDFYNGRCAMEHDISELKGEFAFDVVPTKDWEANSAHQQISLLGYNLVRNFQIDADMAEKRCSGSSRTNILSFESLKTLRFEWINTAGRLLNISGARILRINSNSSRRRRFEDIQEALRAA
jgi:hypothetical protein